MKDYLRQSITKERLLKAAFIASLAALLWAFLIHTVGFISEDDLDLLSWNKETLFERIASRYRETGRITAKIFEWIVYRNPLILYKIALYAALVVYALYFYGYLRMFGVKSGYGTAAFAVVSVFLMNGTVVLTSIRWAAGACNYFFPYLCCFVGAYHLSQHLFFGKRFSFLTGLSIALLAIGAGGSEQLGAVVCGALLCAVVYKLVKKEKPIAAIVSFAAVLLSYLLLIVLTPGRDARALQAAEAYLPDFYEVTLKTRLGNGFRWLVDALVNQSGYLYFTVFALQILLLSRAKKTPLHVAFLTVLSFGAIGFLLRDVFPNLFDFYAVWRPESIPIVNRYMGVFFAAILVACGASIFALPIRRERKILAALLYLASALSTALMVASPTMYASRERTKSIGSFLLLILIALLLGEQEQKETPGKNLRPAVAFSIGVSILGYFELLAVL